MPVPSRTSPTYGRVVSSGKRGRHHRMRLGPIRPAAAAVAVGLPVLLGGMLTSHPPTGQQANADSVRTRLVAPPASSLHQPGGPDEALDGAHPPSDPLVEVVDATGGPGSGTDRGVPIRV